MPLFVDKTLDAFSLHSKGLIMEVQNGRKNKDFKTLMWEEFSPQSLSVQACRYAFMLLKLSGKFPSDGRNRDSFKVIHQEISVLLTLKKHVWSMLRMEGYGDALSLPLAKRLSFSPAALLINIHFVAAEIIYKHWSGSIPAWDFLLTFYICVQLEAILEVSPSQ